MAAHFANPQSEHQLEFLPLYSIHHTSPFLPIPNVQVKILAVFFFFPFHSAQDVQTSHIQPRTGSLDGAGPNLCVFFCYQYAQFPGTVFHSTSFFSPFLPHQNYQLAFTFTLRLLSLLSKTNTVVFQPFFSAKYIPEPSKHLLTDAISKLSK